MEAQTLNCPMCGAPASAASSRCEHCGARLAMVACPTCFGMIFKGAKFCSHCGAPVDRKEENDSLMRPCPRCRMNTRTIVVGKTNLRECPRCEGIWADADALQKVCSNREQQAAVLGMAITIAAPTPASVPLEKVRYVPCPVCRKLMNRVNFAHCSGVVVDVCRPHGTWFDKDELHRIVEFIRAGGLERARQSEIEELERERQRLESARTAASHDHFANAPSYHPMEYAVGAAAASIIGSLFD
jgi:Zn-finger nucleic acid-binding protein